MTDQPSPETPDTDDVATGGGAAEELANSPLRRAAAQLEMLGEEAREKVLDRMDPEIAQQIRDYLTSLPDRPHGQFSTDVATRRKMINELANRVTARKTAEVDSQIVEAPNMQPRDASNPMAGGAQAMQPGAPGAIQVGQAAPLGPVDPLDELRELHPAAIARAMQGERAEAWAIVLDRLDATARGALQLYLDASARAAIEEARARQAELAASAPTLLSTIEAAIARTVVPRAMREHHQLLSTTPLTYTAGMGA